MLRYLIIPLLLLSITAGAQSNDHVIAGSTYAASPIGGAGIDDTAKHKTNVSFCTSLGLGWGNSWFSYNSKKADGNGVWFHFTLGAYFLDAGKKEDHYHLFTARIGYTAITAKTHSNDIPAKYNFNYFEVPGSYMGIRMFQNGHGYYYEGGLNFEFNLGDHDGVKGSNRFTQAVVFPSIGFGYVVAGRTSQKKRAERGWTRDPIAIFGTGRRAAAFCIGPFVTYGANNMSVVDGVSLHALTYGIKILEIVE